MLRFSKSSWLPRATKRRSAAVVPASRPLDAPEGRLQTFWHGQCDGQELSVWRLSSSINDIWRSPLPPSGPSFSSRRERQTLLHPKTFKPDGGYTREVRAVRGGRGEKA